MVAIGTLELLRSATAAAAHAPLLPSAVETGRRKFYPNPYNYDGDCPGNFMAIEMSGGKKQKRWVGVEEMATELFDMKYEIGQLRCLLTNPSIDSLDQVSILHSLSVP